MTRPYAARIAVTRFPATGFPALLAVAWLTACSAPEPARLHGPTMGTSYSITLSTSPEGLDSTALQADIDSLLARINGIMSTYDPDSELSRFNRNPSTDWMPATQELRRVLGEALRISRLSQGAFDVTVGPLVNLWGFGPELGKDTLPAPQAIAGARERVGFGKLQLNASALKKTRSDLYVDLSAIAKGYAVDRVAALLDARGLENYLVEIGGELRARGHSPRGDTWRIAVERPVPGQRTVERVVGLAGQGMATSGDYRNFFELDGQRYSHAMDPRTGYPVRHRLASVTVIRPTCMEADALATALLVLGPERGLALAEREKLAALFIVLNNKGGEETFSVRPSSEFSQYLLQ